MGENSSTSGASKMTLESVAYKSVPKHSDTILSSLEVLWRQGSLTDCVVSCNGQKYFAHRVVLAACADFFHKECMYTGNAFVNDGNVKELLMAANTLGFYFIEDACCDFLMGKLDSSNCIRMINIAHTYNLTDLLNRALETAAHNFAQVTETFEFQTLEAEEMAALLSRDDIQAPDELVVFKRMLEWVEYNPKERLKHSADLLREIRLPLLSPADIVDHVESVENLMDVPGCQKLVKEALHYHCLPARQRGAPRTREQPISDMISFYDESTNTWQRLANMPCRRHHHAVAVLGGFLYVAGGEEINDQRSPQNTVYRFDPRNRKWLQVASMKKARESFQLGVLNGQLYAVGGRVDENTSLAEVEKYSPVVDKWEPIEPISSPRRAIAVAGHNGRLYAVGGSGHLRISSKVERYNPLTGEWESRRPLSQPRFFALLASVGSKLYLAGGATLDPKGNVVCVTKVECYTPVTDTWTTLTQMNEPRAEAGCAVLGQMVYVVGGYSWDRNTRLASVEVYDTAKDRWRNVANLNKQLTGVGCCSLTLYSLKSEPADNAPGKITQTNGHHGDAGHSAGVEQISAVATTAAAAAEGTHSDVTFQKQRDTAARKVMSL